MAYNPRQQVTGQWGTDVSLVTNQFNARLQAMYNWLSSEDAGRLLLKIGFDCLRSFILKNPVKTGRSRAGWYIAMEDVCNKMGRANPYRASSEEQAEGYMAGDCEIQLSGLQKRIKIINGVEYIVPLEFGYSTKAPYGMVRITLQEIMGTVPRDIKKELQAMWAKHGKKAGSEWRSSAKGPVPVGVKWSDIK